MQPQFEKFKELLEKKEAYKKELQADTEAKEKEMLSLDEQYKQALTSNNDKQADTLQDDIYNLKKVIKRNQDKLSLVGKGSDNELEQQALKVLEESNKAIEELNIESDKMVEDYNNMRHEMLTKAIELQRHQSVGTQYRSAMSVVINNVDDFAKNESKKPKSKLTYMVAANGKGISRYSNPTKNPTLKLIEAQHIRQARAGMY